MTDDVNLTALTDELRALEIETFEVVDHVETNELLVAVCSTTSSTTSTTSCSA